MPDTWAAGAHPAVMETEEVQPLASFAQVHDPRLRLLELQAQLGQDGSERRKSALGLRLCPAHHHEIIRVAHQHAAPARPPDPVEPVQVDVAQKRRDNTALRSAGHATPDRALLHHPRAQQRAQQLEQPAVTDPLLDRRHQPIMRNRLKTRGDIRLHHPTPAPPGLIDQDLEGIVRRALWAKPKRALDKVGLEDRLDHRLHGRLHDAVTDSRDRERSKLLAPGLRDEDTARGKRTPAPVPEVHDQFVEQPVDAVPLDVGESGPVDAGRAAIGAHRLPRPLQDVPAMDFVVERVEPSFGVGLGRPVERPLQFSDSVLRGGPSHLRHSPALPCTRRTNEAAALPITPGSVVPRAQAVLRPPPTPTRHATHFPGSPVIGRVAPTATFRRPPGRGGPPQFPPPPSERSTPHTPGGSSGPHSRLFTPSMAFALTSRARLLLFRQKAGTNDAAGFASCCRPLSCSPRRALDAGLRPGPFPDRAASLLPGLLAATRTGLTPAGDDELALDQVTPSTTSNAGRTKKRT